MVAYPGAEAIFPWMERHPDDVAEAERQAAIWQAQRALRQATTSHGARKTYALAALRSEAQNVIDDGRHNEQINRSAYKLFRKYVESGELTKEEVAQEIYAAAYEHGYHTHIIGTLSSALKLSKGEVERMVNR